MNKSYVLLVIVAALFVMPFFKPNTVGCSSAKHDQRTIRVNEHPGLFPDEAADEIERGERKGDHWGPPPEPRGDWELPELSDDYEEEREYETDPQEPNQVGDLGNLDLL